MKLIYSDIEFDGQGRVEVPELMLRTLHGAPIGLIHGASGIAINVKLAEPSELEFDIPASIDGVPNPDYDRVTGHKQIYTKHYGIYETLNPSTSGDGMMQTKHVTAYSLEKTLSNKRFFLEKGTFAFYNATNPADPSTIVGRVLERAVGWSVGTVSTSLFSVYRTFDQIDGDLLDFAYNTIAEKYQCVAVFDTYNKTVSFIDKTADLGTLPIYLDYDNLINKLSTDEKSEELVTALRPFGADELSIREVNPTGSPWIYDLSNFIENGDIPSALAAKWQAWEAKIASRREYYIALISLRASTSARLLSETAKLADLQGELDTLKAERSVIVQALGLDPDSSTLQSQLTAKTTQVNAKQTAIGTQAALITSLSSQLDASVANSYAAKIQAVVDELALTNPDNFTADEQQALQEYFIESDLTEDTFVATDIDTNASGTSTAITAITTFAITGAEIQKPTYSDDANRAIYLITGGSLSVSGGTALSGKLIGGTIEANVASSGDKSFVMSLHCGEMTVNGTAANNLMLTVSGTFYTDSNHPTFPYTSDVAAHTVDGVTAYTGTRLTARTRSAAMYVTATISGLQQLTVQRELYDYAVKELKELSAYAYEFSVDAGNFLFARDFEAFRDQLELGKGIYLNVDGLKVITPLIEMKFSFDDETKLDLVFCNRFRRHDPVNTLKDMIEKTYSTTRSIDAGKHLQGLVNDQASAVAEFMNASLDAAKNRIIAAGNQSVTIDGAGIHIGETSGQYASYQLGIVNNMIAMTDDNWEHAKLAIGLFATPNNGTYFGVNADVIAGKLIVGSSMIIECPGQNSVMQFKVDSSGAWLDNGRLVMRNNGGGRMLIDPTNGIVAGKANVTDGDLFTVNGTTVTTSYRDQQGNIKPNVSFMLDMSTGDAYFAGEITAKAFYNQYGQSLLGPDGKIVEEYIDTTHLSSRITQNAQAIETEVTRASAAEGTLSSRITQNATSITTEVTRAKGAESTLGSRITQTADDITAEVTRASTAEGNLSTRITANATGLTTKVEKNGVISSINQTSETVKINAAKINLSGYVTVDSLKSGGTTVIDGGRITTGTIAAARLDLSGVLTATDVGSSGTTKIDGGRITTGTIAAARIDADNLSIKTIYAPDNTHKLLSAENSKINIGGNTSWEYGTINIFGTEINIGRYSQWSSSTICIDTSTGTIHPKGSNYQCDLGTSNYPFVNSYIKNMYPYSVVGCIGSSTSKWNKAYITDLYLYGTLEPSGALTYLGTSSKQWSYAYIGKFDARIGSTDSNSKISFFGATSQSKLTVSLTSMNVQYTSVTENNYLIALNNLIGILKKYGLVGA